MTRTARTRAAGQGGITLLETMITVMLAGLIMAGYIGRVDATLTRGLNLDSIAAAVVG